MVALIFMAVLVSWGICFRHDCHFVSGELVLGNGKLSRGLREVFEGDDNGQRA